MSGGNTSYHLQRRGKNLRLALVAAFVLMVVALAYLANLAGTSDHPRVTWKGLRFALAIGLLLTPVAIAFLFVFTRQLTGGPVAEEKELRPLVLFAYAFILYCVALSIAPAVLIQAIPQSAYNDMVRSPVGLLKGCVHADESDKTWELACRPDDPYRVQWLVNLGGGARLAKKGFNTAEGGFSATDAEGMDAWVDPDYFRPAIIHGGLVAPWYVISLAIIGATVGLARKVPEFQRRALDAGDDRMDAHRMREFLCFQVLQVLSAPLIALTAYNVLKPANLQVSAALGFTSGFSSELILMGIRSLVDRNLGLDKPEIKETAAPTITLPLANGASTVSGTSTEPDGTIIQVSVDGKAVATANVAAKGWTATLPAPLQTGQVVVARAIPLSKDKRPSGDTTPVTVT